MPEKRVARSSQPGWLCHKTSSPIIHPSTSATPINPIDPLVDHPRASHSAPASQLRSPSRSASCHPQPSLIRREFCNTAGDTGGLMPLHYLLKRRQACHLLAPKTCHFKDEGATWRLASATVG